MILLLLWIANIIHFSTWIKKSDSIQNTVWIKWNVKKYNVQEQGQV